MNDPRLSLVTAPAVRPLLLQEVKDHLRVDSTSDDAYIDALISAAVSHLDGRDGCLGRALITQTWRADWLVWPRDDVMRLPLPPAQSVSSIQYLDTDGALQTLASSEYVVNTSGMPGMVTLADGRSWPSLYSQRGRYDVVQVTFVAGYGSSWNDIPQDLKAAMLLLIGHWYANREAVNIGNITTSLPLAVDTLLTKYKWWGP